MGRIIGGIIAGIISAFATIWIIDLIRQGFYPIPTDIRMTKQGIGAFFNSMPPGALAFVLGSWFFGALDGGLVAILVSRRRWTAWLVAALVAAAAILNALVFPQIPLLLQIGSIAAPALGALVATRVARSRRLGEAIPPESGAA